MITRNKYETWNCQILYSRCVCIIDFNWLISHVGMVLWVLFLFCWSMQLHIESLYRPGQITVEQKRVKDWSSFIRSPGLTCVRYNLVLKRRNSVAPEVANEPIPFISVTCSARTTKSYKSAFIRWLTDIPSGVGEDCQVTGASHQRRRSHRLNPIIQ